VLPSSRERGERGQSDRELGDRELGDIEQGDQITAIVVSYNSGQHIRGLAHALTHSKVVPRRWLLIDNDSSDDSVQAGEAAGFEVHRLNENRGFGGGCNVGLNAATTELVLFCNPDVLPADDALGRLVAALATAPDAAIVGAALQDPPQARRFSRLSSNLWQFLPRSMKRVASSCSPATQVDVKSPAIVVDFAEGALILARTDALRSVGGFDESFFLYSEEEDLSRRLRQRRWVTLMVPSARASHAVSKSSAGVDRAIMASFRFHSLYWYYRRYHGRWYAECARCLLAFCVMLDRGYRRVRGEPHLYSAASAVAAFRDINTIRRDHERQMRR
jgi:GT2 family glycosyltransferase